MENTIVKQARCKIPRFRNHTTNLRQDDASGRFPFLIICKFLNLQQYRKKRHVKKNADEMKEMFYSEWYVTLAEEYAKFEKKTFSIQYRKW